MAYMNQMYKCVIVLSQQAQEVVLCAIHCCQCIQPLVCASKAMAMTVQDHLVATSHVPNPSNILLVLAMVLRLMAILLPVYGDPLLAVL